MKRWQRLDIEPGDAKGGFDVLVQNTATSLKGNETYPEIPKNHDHQAVISFLCSDCTIVGILGHIEYPHPFGSDVTSYAIRAANIAVDYFEGDWRDGYAYLSDHGVRKLNHQQCRKKLDWTETYREGLMWSLCLDLDDSLAKLLAWPGTDLPYDDGTFRLSQEDNTYHVVLARSLQGESLSQCTKLTNAIRTSSRRRPKMLLETLECILLEDSGGFKKNFTKWLRLFIRTEFQPQQVWLVFSIEGTILWHIARRVGLALPELDELETDLIITKESLQSSEE